MHRHPALHPDADGGDLALRPPVRGRAPHSRAAVDASDLDPQSGAGGDQRLLEPANVLHDVDRVGERDDRVPHELAGPVPGDPSAPVDIHDGGAVHRSIRGLGPLTRRVGRRMLQQQHGVASGPVGALLGEGALEIPGGGVLDHAEPADLRWVRVAAEGLTVEGHALQRRPPPRRATGGRARSACGGSGVGGRGDDDNGRPPVKVDARCRTVLRFTVRDRPRTRPSRDDP